MKRSTLFISVVFIILVGLLFYLDQRKPAAVDLDVAPSAQPDKVLFSESKGVPTNINIRSNAGDKVGIERSEAGDWVLYQPIEAEANQGSAEAAASQVSSLRILSELEVASDVVGLKSPSYYITVKFSDESEIIIRIGDLTPTSSGYYANLVGTKSTIIINKSGIEALLNLLETPPYINTPIP